MTRLLAASAATVGLSLLIIVAPTAAPQGTAKVSVNVPSMAPLPETELSQLKGGLRITVTPYTYKDEEDKKASARSVNPGFKDTFKPHKNGDVFVERTITPFLKITPDHLMFRVEVNNQLPRVFRGSGMVVQFTVAGKNQVSDPSGYGALVNAILTPRASETFDVSGPLISSVPESTTIGFFLFDVVTGTDAAGNINAKQNFEWYFSYRCQTVEKEIGAPVTEKLWVTPRRH